MQLDFILSKDGVPCHPHRVLEPPEGRQPLVIGIGSGTGKNIYFNEIMGSVITAVHFDKHISFGKRARSMHGKQGSLGTGVAEANLLQTGHART